MPCKPLMCTGAHDCLDHHCPGHPHNLRTHEGGAQIDTDSMDEMLTVSSAILAAVTIFCVIGAVGWFLYTVGPLFIASIRAAIS